MKTSRNSFFTGIPLLPRVVFLYFVIGASAVTAQLITPSTTSLPVSNIQPATAVAFEKEENEPIITGLPTRIQIERLDIDLQIKDGVYDAANDSWSLSDDYVHYATATVTPNNKRGSTFLYGHNTWKVLYKTIDIEKGDIAKVTTGNGYTFSYIYTGDDSVAPTTTEVLNENPATPRLTLMTCEGWFSATRRLMYFEFLEVTK